ncbi:hypothetical protein PR003_g18443 [Phytophthora rubi]|uniref:Uncharacterized protein n=1 Tax=Phytophthora rubi TaxID=129364 RepID=A0A6A4E0L6_9STRA|nr:hypothetical protein PR001_g17552 [Phytophthora rubi]KAE9317578.1 hypothetical protein PR003_g18443 [Phytophthora rubi]
MDADDEPAMAYFLPNGIADDSPPKQSRMKASFGPIGGRFAASSSSKSTATSSASATALSAASGASNSRSDMEFSALHTRPRPTLEPPPFGASGGPVSSPRPTNFLLSDLGGEIHTPRASRDFGDSGGSTPTASRPFGFPGPFGSGLGDGGAGAIRSPTSSMFDRGQEAAKSFSRQGEGRRTSPSYGTEAQQLYRAGTTNLSSYLGAGDDDSPFGGNSMRTWPSSTTEGPQPRRVLQRPPGLAGPPGLSEPNTMDGVQPRMHLGSAGGSLMQQRVSAPQFGPFHPSASSPMAGGANRAFSSGEDQYGPSLLSSFRLSSGVFGDTSLHDQNEGRGVSNPDLAELNTHSMKVDEMDGMRIRHAVDSPSAPWENCEPTTSRRIDIQARSKTPRSPKKARDARRKSEGRSDLRAKALEFSMDAINAFTPGSPMRPRRGRKTTSPASGYENSQSSVENSRDRSASRGKRRNQPADKTAATASLSSAGSDNWRRGPANQSEELASTRGPPPGLETDGSPVKLASREANKSRRREESKPSNRSTASRRNSTRGNDKGASTTRRQVYREKQAKENVKEALPEEVTPVVASSSAASRSPQKSQSSADNPKSETKTPTIPQNAKDVATFSVQPAAAVPKATDVSTKVDAEIGTTTAIESAIEHGDEVESANPDRVKNTRPDEGASLPETVDTSPETPPEEPATSTERESSSSSDVLEDAQDAVNEHSESQQERAAMDEILSPVESSEDDFEQVQVPTQGLPTAQPKKSTRKTSAMAAASADSSPAIPRNETELLSMHEPTPAPLIEKKHAAKEHRKEKSKKDKGEKKKPSRGKKDKKGASVVSKAADTLSGSTNEAQDKILEDLATRGTPLSARITQGLCKGGSAAASAGLIAFHGTRRGCVWAAGRLNIKGLLATSFSYVESVLAVVFSVLLLLSLHAASWFIRIHRVAFRAILTHRHIGFCFAFLYGFPFLVQYVFPWAPPWAPVCLWYAFLVQLFCTNGPTAMVTTFRVILPLVFLVEGISHHSFLLDLNGAELLLTSFIISALKTSNLCSPIFFLSLATQCLLAVFLGSELVVQWLQLTLALYSLHVMAASDDEWIGIGDDEEELSCHPVSMHHSIADYNHQPAPSSAVSIQKTKRLDRRALAYVRGRKLR